MTSELKEMLLLLGYEEDSDGAEPLEPVLPSPVKGEGQQR